MESRLLYDLYLASLLDRNDLSTFLKQKIESDTQKLTSLECLDYYNVIYSEKLSNLSFLDCLRRICNGQLLKGELKNKYIAIISLVYKKYNSDNGHELLYLFFTNKEHELLKVDFDFWNLISTDWQLKIGGFTRIMSSKKMKKYLSTKADLKMLSDFELLTIISTMTVYQKTVD